MSSVGLTERDLRDWSDELRVGWDEFRLEVRTAPPTPLTPDERWQDALAGYRDALAEASSKGIEPPSYPTKIAEEAIANVDASAVLDDDERRLVIEEESGDLGWAAQQIEQFARFERFGVEEAERRRQLAETLRRRALKRVQRSGGSYLAARENVLAGVLASPIGLQRNRRTGARPRGRRPRTSRTSRGSPGRSTDDPEPAPPLGRRHSRQTATKLRYAASSPPRRRR